MIPRILIQVFILAAVLLTPAQRRSVPKRIPPPAPWAQYVDSLLWAESRGKHKKANGRVIISPKGAIGRWQVIPETVGYFNMKNGENFLVRDAFDEKTNARIGRWYLDFCGVKAGSNLVYTFNAYHQGHNAGRKKIFERYVASIVPREYSNFISTKKVIRREGGYVWIR